MGAFQCTLKNMQLETIQAPIEAQLVIIDQLIAERLESQIPLIREIYQHIIQSGGKRLRPMLSLLAAGTCSDISAKQLELALIIEFIHTATLLHDDVVDESHMRRGQPSANALWGNQASVLVGDFLLARAFQLLVTIDHTPLLELLSTTTRDIAAGEVLQLSNRNDPDTTRERYLQVIEYKTATLFAAASQGPALLAQCTHEHSTALTEFGLNLGLSFQLIDDALDYSADSATLGKNIGDDLKEGKPTLPLIHALEQGNAQQQQLIRMAISHADEVPLDEILAAIAATDAIAYTYQVARTYADKASSALMQLPASKYRDSLANLLEFSFSRQH